MGQVSQVLWFGMKGVVVDVNIIIICLFAKCA